MNCRVCSRPLKSESSIKRGIGPECERSERLEKENENQVTLVTNRDIPKELKRNKRGISTKLRYKGNNYALQDN